MIEGYLNAAGAVATGSGRPVLGFLARKMLEDGCHAKAPATLAKYEPAWQRFKRWVNLVLPGLTSVYDVPRDIVALHLTQVRLQAASPPCCRGCMAKKGM
jgi:hypothetical protein